MGKTGTTLWAQVKASRVRSGSSPRKRAKPRPRDRTSGSRQAQMSSRSTRWQRPWAAGAVHAVAAADVAAGVAATVPGVPG